MQEKFFKFTTIGENLEDRRTIITPMREVKGIQLYEEEDYDENDREMVTYWIELTANDNSEDYQISEETWTQINQFTNMNDITRA